MELYAVLKNEEDTQAATGYCRNLQLMEEDKLAPFMEALNGQGLPMALASGQYPEEPSPQEMALHHMARYGYLEFNNAPQHPEITLGPVSTSFSPHTAIDTSAPVWKVSRFAYLHMENGHTLCRNPKALCELKLHHHSLSGLIAQFSKPLAKKKVLYPSVLKGKEENIFRLLALAQIIYPCDNQGHIEEDREAAERQWEFHDLLFHSSTRLGRNGRPLGGSFRFKGILEPQPAIKPNPWAARSTPLPRPDMEALHHHDMTLTAALETRRSIRQHSPMPLTINQLGELLYRALRIKYTVPTEWGGSAWRPYPGGGAMYESEFYLTIDACAGLQRGFYYYDAANHALSFITAPNEHTEALIDHANIASGSNGRPHVLISVASRFHRMHWKYTAMSYAAQLKNVGVIFQTLYLVATAMQLAPSALGAGDPDRLAQLTGEDYLVEGSVGEFIIGRPSQGA